MTHNMDRRRFITDATLEYSDISQANAYYEGANTLERRLQNRKLNPESSAVFVLEADDIPDSTFVPEVVQRYRDVGAPISDVYVSIDASSQGSAVSLQIFCGPPENARIFSFDRDIASHEYVCRKGNELIEVPTNDIERCLVELALLPAQQAEMEPRIIIDGSHGIDITNPVTAQLLAESLQKRATKTIYQSIYNLGPPDAPDALSFQVTREDFLKTYTFSWHETADDGPIAHQLSASVTLQRRLDPDSTDVNYTLTPKASRSIRLEGSRTFMPDDAPQEDAVIEWAIAHMKQLSSI